ncbi:sodium-coupled monocarboxylate transporter 2-like [Lutzomyia longipalpis]|uniref:sodium-coupled monocarboxylate transporter 2-like n=1 Tax=Lutzomyia longipalpis TaxID=7200 RepID=UPI0024839873|nr:sodium-coupled monocarboxylate transporter 2-like [Lutzomyia longipalpis]
MEQTVQFSFLDYSFFGVMVIVSASIGLYYAVKSRNKTATMEDYLLGGRKMGLFPISCSLIATSLTGTTIVGLTAETYTYGTYPWLYSVCIITMAICNTFIFLPVFSELKLTSSFKYLEMRFSRRVRLLASGLFLLTGLIFLPITVYVPALTFQSVTGVNTYTTVVVLSLLCAAYTALGGFKAVVWTDVVQVVLMIVSFVVVIVIGTNTVGGFENVFEAGKRGQRLIFVK